MSNKTFSFKSNKQQIEINIELEDETLENIKISPLTVNGSKLDKGMTVEEYYDKVLLSILRKNKDKEEIKEKLKDNLTVEEITQIINQSREELRGKYLKKD